MSTPVPPIMSETKPTWLVVVKKAFKYPILFVLEAIQQRVERWQTRLGAR